MEYKALDAASAETHLSHVKLLQQCGAIPSIHDYHLGAFLREYFPKGADFQTDDDLLKNFKNEVGQFSIVFKE